MKSLLRSPFTGLILTGITASIALLLEASLPVSENIHFLLELLWLSVISAGLLTIAMLPVWRNLSALTSSGRAGNGDAVAHNASETLPELLDEDRLWLQAHPESSSNRWR